MSLCREKCHPDAGLGPQHSWPQGTLPATPRRLQDGWLWVLQGHQDFGFSSSYVTHLPQEMTRNWGYYDRRKKSVSPEIQPATNSSTGIVWQGRALVAPAEGTLVKV
ncbi:hypothetical protein J1605_002481 [Eschrichtius robustus]|uniref:Uncharacterized protein n=1 Tax=Eschrichtius robustus TaxID=9764 RepID=A0AB34HWH0_ESCRO|nr:hypothetical protein J1605_002481 [Eschrichtius robustus]